MRIGVLSDTHGLLRAEVVSALAGVDQILHAGDLGDAAILDTLRSLAPTTAVRGNIDTHGPCALLPEREYLIAAGRNFYMLHDVSALDIDPAAAEISAVIFGHSHKPLIEWRRGVLFFNPGAAGPRRFSLPVSLGLIECTPSGLEPTLVTLL